MVMHRDRNSALPFDESSLDFSPISHSFRQIHIRTDIIYHLVYSSFHFRAENTRVPIVHIVQPFLVRQTNAVMIVHILLWLLWSIKEVDRVPTSTHCPGDTVVFDIQWHKKALRICSDHCPHEQSEVFKSIRCLFLIIPLDLCDEFHQEDGRKLWAEPETIANWYKKPDERKTSPSVISFSDLLIQPIEHIFLVYLTGSLKDNRADYAVLVLVLLPWYRSYLLAKSCLPYMVVVVIRDPNRYMRDISLRYPPYETSVRTLSIVHLESDEHSILFLRKSVL